MSSACGQFVLVAACTLAAAAVVSFAQSSGPAEKPVGPGEPFWRAKVVEGESVLFVQDGETPPKAALLLKPGRIVRVASASGEVVYEEGKDFLHATGSSELTLPDGSRIPFKTLAQLHPPKGGPQTIGETIDGKSSLFFSEGHVFHDLQAVVTYEPAEPWRGWTPKYAGDSLPRTMARLKAGEPLKIVVFGDSISAGGNASGAVRVKPFQPAYPLLVARGLMERYPAKVTLKNLSVGGTISKWGVENIDKVSAEEPDLVVLAFGMNDAGGIDPKVFGENNRKMIEAVRAKRPEAEFILVACLVGNPEWKSLRQASFPANRDELAKLCGPGVALADMTSLWLDLLKHKRFVDLTGNGVNHINDFGHRLYAQVILDVLVPPGQASSAPAARP